MTPPICPVEAPPRILIVEDDVATAQVYQRLLEAHGYEVKVAPDGEFAQAALVFQKPDLVVLDLMLPKVPGVEVLHFLRSRDDGRQIPTIVFSNAMQSPLGEAARMKGGGATQYLAKADCSPERFLGAVQYALARSRLIRKLDKEMTTGSAPNALAEGRLMRADQPKPGAPARSEESVTAPAESAPAPSQPISSTPLATSPPAIPFPSPPGPISESSLPPPPAPVAVPGKPDAAPAPADQLALGASAVSSRLDRNAIEVIQSELRQTFLQSAPPKIAALSARLLEVTKSKTPPDWASFLGGFQVALAAAMANAGFAGLGHIARFSTALEGLIKDLREEEEGVNPSALRTMVNALDFLISLLQEATQTLEQPPPEPLVMVVDDEPICRSSASIALRAAGMKTISMEDPLLALRVLAENQLDLVVTDVDMPVTDGYELCKQLRLMRKHKTTPVIFLTGLGDFQSRARSALSGGNEYIVKPFVPAELVVKALTLIMKPPAKGK